MDPCWQPCQTQSQRPHMEHGGRLRTWRRASIEHYPQSVERWRRVLGHEGYFLAELRVATPEEGGSNRAIQGGYHAQWWVVEEAAERWVGSGPIDFADEQRSIKPGGVGHVKIRPMAPASWHGVGAGSVLHLRERVGQTLGVATVASSIGVPADAPLRLSRVPLRSGAVRLEAVRPTFWERLRHAARRR